MRHRSTLTRFLLSGTAAIAMTATMSLASAQDDVEIADAEKKLGVITVTAEKRTESTQDVGQSIQAFDSEGLERAGVDDVSRLDQIVSGVNFAFVGNDSWNGLVDYPRGYAHEARWSQTRFVCRI